jgi:hypothetical protein
MPCFGVQHIVETPFPKISLGFFLVNMGAVSDEHHERFHQGISRMEKRYSSKWNPDILSDYCWTVVPDTPTEEYKRRKIF